MRCRGAGLVRARRSRGPRPRRAVMPAVLAVGRAEDARPAWPTTTCPRAVPFLDNLEQWPCRWRDEWPPPGPSERCPRRGSASGRRPRSTTHWSTPAGSSPADTWLAGGVQPHGWKGAMDRAVGRAEPRPLRAFPPVPPRRRSCSIGWRRRSAPAAAHVRGPGLEPRLGAPGIGRLASLLSTPVHPTSPAGPGRSGRGLLAKGYWSSCYS